jgi:hypothetical protein
LLAQGTCRRRLVEGVQDPAGVVQRQFGVDLVAARGGPQHAPQIAVDLAALG